MRLQLTKRADYAIRACVHLAGQDRCPVSGRLIASRMAIPDSFLPQVMADLGRAGIVNAVNGKHGGYCLRRDPATLTVLELVEAVEGPGLRGPCAVDETPCGGDPTCALNPVWAAARNAFVDVLAGASIGQLVARQRAVDQNVGPDGPERTHR